MTEFNTLADALPDLMAKVRDVVIPAYEEVAKVAPMTKLTIAAIKAELDQAARALASGDVVAMLKAHAALKDIYDSM